MNWRLLLSLLASCGSLLAQPASGAADLERAAALLRNGSAAESKQLLSEVVPRLRQTRDEPLLAKALAASAEASVSLGDYPAAIRDAGEAAGLFQSQHDAAGEAGVRNTIGLAHLYLSDYDQALTAYQAAMGLNRTAGNAEGEVTCGNNIGNVYFFEGRYLDALREYESAMATVKSHPGAPWYERRRQITTANLATLFQRLGRYQKALNLYLELRATPQAMRASEQARLLVNLGALYRRLGDPQKALETYRTAQKQFAGAAHKDGEIGAWKNIGIVQGLDLGDMTAALDAFEVAGRLAEESGNRHEAVQARLYHGEAPRRLHRLAEARRDLESAAAGANEIGSREDEWRAFHALGRIDEEEGETDRALEFYKRAISRIESIRSGLELLLLRRDFLTDKRDVYDAAIRILVDRPATGKPGSLDEVLRLIERSRARLGKDATPPPGAGSIQSRLAANCLLLVFWEGPARNAVLYLTQTSAGLVPLDPVNPAALRGAAAQGAEGWLTTANDLGAKLLGGIAPLADSRYTNVLIVPDGSLHTIPFETLGLPKRYDPARRILLEKASVTYLPSTAILLQETPSRRWSPPWRRQLIAFADPERATGSPLDEGFHWKRLPGAANEVQAIAALMPGKADLHIGPDARKQYLLHDAAGAPLLHFATHALADRGDPESSRIAFAPAQPGKGLDFLFLREIYGLSFRGAALITASACDTEAGGTVRGEGVEGFSRAFLSAGAAATVTTLWPIPDQPSAELMKQFYHRLAQGETKAEALRQAKLTFYRSGSRLAHPRYWAAFILSGDGSSPLPPVVSWRLVIAGTLGVLTLAAALLLLRGLLLRKEGSRR